MLITVIRNFAWFEIPIDHNAHKKYQEYISRQDSRVYPLEQIQEFLRTTPRVDRPFYFTPNNIFIILLPIVLISFLVFFGVGLFGQNPKEVSKIFIYIQAISYVILISATTLTLAIYFIRDLNTKKNEEKERGLVKNVLQLAYENNVFNELPQISLIAQWSKMELPFTHIFIFKVENRYYIITVDINVNKIVEANGYDTHADLINALRGNS